MKCFKCDSAAVNCRKFTDKTLEDSSPKRGKNKRYRETKMIQFLCTNCGSGWNEVAP